MMEDSEPTKQKPERMWYSVNMTFLPIKGFYFSTLAGVGALLPFIALYMRQLGLSQSETGVIYGIMPFIGFLVRPLIGAVSDRSGKPKTMLCISCVLSAIFYVLILVVPSRENSDRKIQVEIECSEFDSYIRDCYRYNRTDKNCYASFIDFLPSEKSTVEMIVTLNSSKSIDTNSTYSSSIPLKGSEDTVISPCSLQCEVKDSSLTSTACFTNSSSDLTNSPCTNLSVQIASGSRLELTLPDIASVIAREVEEDRQTEGDQVCRDFDLKDLMYKESSYFQMLCTKEVTLKCDVDCKQEGVEICSKRRKNDSETFWLFFVIFLFANIAFAPVISLGDAMAYDILGDENRNRWGKQRLFGTIGFALFAVGTTFTSDLLSEDQLNADFTVCFIVTGFLFLLSGFVSCFLPISQDMMCGSMIKNVRQLLSHIQVMIFLCVVLLFGFFTGCIEAFLFWFLAEDLRNKMQIIPGLCLFCNCLSETFLLFFVGFIIKRLGHLNCLYSAFVCYALRFLCYTFLTDPWQVLPIELLHGVTFGVFWAAGTSYASIIAPPGLSATVQGILGGVHFGFGKGIGSLVTGWLYKPLGFRWIFRLYSILAVVFLLCYIVFNKLYFKFKTAYGEKKTPEREDEMEGNKCSSNGS
ncbi:hypothetical protein FSP39_000211 [Pinctada imbricata]|uniref:Major facilitator superfamily (MFS) profile domain-containing protein n=1 Tax=Pinctada imbricata TaxID=66713 RepID=A0AA89C2W2_PINIB|nr:hypothetical protein FSP39_000211 [Pinctada imbricata]